jgi:hypothetical protein
MKNPHTITQALREMTQIVEGRENLQKAYIKIMAAADLLVLEFGDKARPVEDLRLVAAHIKRIAHEGTPSA